MGTRVEIDGKAYEVVSYSVSEDSTPTSSDDSSGSVGSISLEVKGVDEPFQFGGKEVALKDSVRGSTLGTVSKVDETDNGTTKLECISRLGKLNIFGVQSQPFVGTLRDAFQYYVSLTDTLYDVLVDDSIARRPVVFPGWEGELWFHMKQMAAAQDCEIALVSNIIVLRPLRVRELVDQYNVSRSRSYGGSNLARSVEVYAYQNEQITNDLVYPPGGWVPEVEVLTVNAGEEMEQDIELSASVSRIYPPEMVTFVSKNHRTSSVYTIVGDDGFPIVPQQWRDYGGSLTVEINPDTTSLKVKLRGPEGIRSDKGEPINTFSVALGSDTTGNRYSTLRLMGDGVAFDKELIKVRTMIPDHVTGTEVGATIDNPFLSSLEDAYAAGVRAAKEYAGEVFELSSGVVNVEQVGESGRVSYASYDDVQNTNTGLTYDEVKALHLNKTYRKVNEEYQAASDTEADLYDFQVFGNVGGVRVWDEKSRRWFRTRQATVAPGDVAISAEDDLTYRDFDDLYYTRTYGEEQQLFPRLSFSERDRKGLWVESYDEVPKGLYPENRLFPATDIFPIGVL